MAREKSQAVIYSARLNPINEIESKAIGIIKSWETQGFNFKQLIVDRILRCEGYTPEMFSQEAAPRGAEYFIQAVSAMLAENRPNEQQIAGAVAIQMEDLFTRFASELMDKIKDKSIAVAEKPSGDEDEQQSAFARKFAKKFLQRQQQGLGGDD